MKLAESRITAWIMRKLGWIGWAWPTGTIYIDFDRYRKLDEQEKARLIRHEQKHLEQYERDGFLKYLWRWWYQLLDGKRLGMSWHESYLAIDYEIEARKAEK